MGCWQLLAPAVVVLMSSSYSYETQLNVPVEASQKTGRMEMCPQGMFLSPRMCRSLSSGCTCVACPSGYYQNSPNLEVSCQRCSYCLSYLGQTVVRTCTATQDTECGCKRGYYKAAHPFHDSNDLNCKKCTNCSTTHQETPRDCLEAADAECGGCLPTFCDFGGHCQPCPRTTPQQEQLINPTFPSNNVTPGVETCGTACQSSTWWLSGIIGSCAFLLLLVGSLVVYCKRSRSGGLRPPPSAESSLNVYAGKPSSGESLLERHPLPRDWFADGRSPPLLSCPPAGSEAVHHHRRRPRPPLERVCARPGPPGWGD